MSKWYKPWLIYACWSISVLFLFKAHYSLKKGAAVLGIGCDNVFPVKVDSIGRMIPAELDKKIQQLKSEVCWDLI